MDGTAIVILVLVLWIGSAFAASILAGIKGRSPSRWFWMTLIFGAIPLVFIVFLPTVEPPAQGLTAQESRELLAALREREKVRLGAIR